MVYSHFFQHPTDPSDSSTQVLCLVHLYKPGADGGFTLAQSQVLFLFRLSFSSQDLLFLQLIHPSPQFIQFVYELRLGLILVFHYPDLQVLKKPHHLFVAGKYTQVLSRKNLDKMQSGSFRKLIYLRDLRRPEVLLTDHSACLLRSGTVRN